MPLRLEKWICELALCLFCLLDIQHTPTLDAYIYIRIHTDTYVYIRRNYIRIHTDTYVYICLHTFGSGCATGP